MINNDILLLLKKFRILILKWGKTMLNLRNYLCSGQTIVSNLLLRNYHHLGLSSEEFLFILEIHMFQLEGDMFPDLQVIGMDMGLEQDKIYQILNRLVSGGYIKIETTIIDEKKSDCFDLYPLYDLLDDYLKSKNKQQAKNEKEKEIQSIYQLFEQEFGRPLSPIEFQRIGQWIDDDHYEPEIIKLALREAVLNQAYSFNYVDRILLSWERKNLKTKQQVEEDQQRRKQQLLQKEVDKLKTTEELPKVSLKNWLEE